MKNIKPVFIIIWLVVLVIWLLTSFSSPVNYLPLICYWFTFGWIFIVWGFKLKDIFSLKFSFGTFMLGGLIVSLGFLDSGEILMKFAFIMLIVGFIQTLINRRQS